MAEATEAKAAPPSISWDSHTYVDQAPESLVRDDDLSGANMDMRRRFEANCRRAQNEICKAVEELDGAKFQQDVWTREGGGGGISRVLASGNVFEKAGCSLSVVYGSMPQEALASATTRGADRAKGYAPGERVPFFACGLSSVMHPRNPMAPTMHFNYRYFETEGGVWWFGGGSDLTPSYLFEEDVKHFHGTYKAVCDKHDAEFYPRFKKWADEYFYIKHRGETRGLGGIFFDGAPATHRPVRPPVRPPRFRGALCSPPSPARRPQRPRPRDDLRVLEGVPRLRRPRVRAARGEAQGRRVHAGAEGVAADAPRALRRVQPGVRPRHRLRAQDGRPHRVDPHVAARDGAMGVLARAGARLARGRHTRRLQERARLVLI